MSKYPYTLGAMISCLQKGGVTCFKARIKAKEFVINFCFIKGSTVAIGWKKLPLILLFM